MKAAGDEALQAESEGTSVPSDPVTVIHSEEQVRIRLASIPNKGVQLERYIVSEERVINVVLQRGEVRPGLEPIPPDEQEQVDVSRHAAASGFREGLPEKVL